ncbi:FtsX-like permease family protein [Psychroserpens sp.]|uniref:ABC transporter permease n=1 Tax=Psychroserpens sp. TaxID=2020870 RepID=UPI003C7638ED
MIKNYFKIAWRNITKHKAFSLINILSLSIGLSAALIIGMMVYHDFSFDKFHSKGNQIYRAVSDLEMNDDKFGNPGTPIPLGQTMAADYPEVEMKAHLLLYSTDKVISTSTQKVSTINDRAIFVEPSYFELFKYKWLAGNPNTALDKPNKTVLVQSRAAYFFPNLTPNEIIGQVLDYGEMQTSVSGIVADFEQNTDIIFNEFISYDTVLQTKMKGTATQDFGSINSSSQLFVRLRSDADIASVNERLRALAISNWDEDSIEFGLKSYYRLQPLSDIHFNTKYGIYDNSRSQADKSVLTALGLVALFLLSLGVVNFVNLNTANATKRAKEIGVRKTLGSSRSQLIKQFLGETFILTLLATVVSIGVTFWLLNVFSDFIVGEVDLSLLSEPLVAIGVIVLILIVALAAGFYPSLVLSSFKPNRVLKGDIKTHSGGSSIRKGLTVFQFAVAHVFIIATLLVGKQIHYVMNRDMGFAKENRLFVNAPFGEKDFSKKETFQTLVKRIPGVEAVSLGSQPPASTSGHINFMEMTHNNKGYKTEIRMLYGDTDYLEMYNIPLIAGRQLRNDTIMEFVLNEKAVSTLGFQNPEDILNKQVMYEDTLVSVVGVVKDFNQRTLKDAIMPLAFTGDLARSGWSHFGMLHIKTSKNIDLPATISQIENAYLNVFPNNTFEINFIDQTIANFYSEDEQLAKLLNWATGLAILISCLGLLGLVIHTTERRTKEIGIRKVLGASLLQINTLLCKEFLILVAIAFVIAAPIAYYGINNWLQDFSYKTSISFWVFLVSGCAMILFALLVISAKTLRAANANPVNSLRSE